MQRQGCRRGVPSSSALGFTERDGRLLGSLLPLILRRSHPRRRRALRLAAPCHHRGRWDRHPRGTQGTQGMGQPRSRRPGEALAQSPVGGPRLKVGEGSLGAEGVQRARQEGIGPLQGLRRLLGSGRSWVAAVGRRRRGAMLRPAPARLGLTRRAQESHLQQNPIRELHWVCCTAADSLPKSKNNDNERGVGKTHEPSCFSPYLSTPMFPVQGVCGYLSDALLSLLTLPVAQQSYTR